MVNIFGVGGATSPLLHQANLGLVDSEVRGLPTSPITIVGAPGANKIIFPVNFLLYLSWVANFANIDPTARIQFDINNGGVSTGISESYNAGISNLLADDADTMMWLSQLSNVDVTGTQLCAVNFYTPSDQINNPLRILAANGLLGNFTLGTGSILNVGVLFFIFSVSSWKFLTVQETGWNQNTRTFS